MFTSITQLRHDVRVLNLPKLQRNWDLLGRTDPLWAILFDPTKRGNRWRPEEFFATGRQEVARLLADLDRVGVPVRPGRALDFGCGAGRLTQALAEPFEEVDGVDIAPSLLALAERYNRCGLRCRTAAGAPPWRRARRWPAEPSATDLAGPAVRASAQRCAERLASAALPPSRGHGVAWAAPGGGRGGTAGRGWVGRRCHHRRCARPRLAHLPVRGSQAATQLTRATSRGNWPWRAPSCAGPARRSHPGCSVRVSHAPTRWKRW